ncbi:MAG: ATPase, P-type (transporting), superfamily, subfamily, partial [Chromatiaceae bacterium]|nr:ATPase, P-type (transporting), superfamily, subfamily [Chromatiaceae bacterium]
MTTPNPWHLRAIGEVLAELSTSPEGLSADQAADRLAEQGPNELPSADSVSPWSILGEQFKNLLVIILLIAVGISAFLGEVLEAVVIAVIVLFAILLGFVQEYRAERAMEALRRMAAPTARVLRGGRELVIPSRELVPGDLVLLGAGDRIPADLRLIEAFNLRVNEAALTGESQSVDKTTDTLSAPDLGVGDRVNLAYSGTDVVYGRGRGLAVATGLDTQFGQVTGMLAAVEQSRTPLQQNLDRVGRVLAVAAGLVVVLIAGLGVLRGEPLLEMFIFGVALAVAVVPEALPAVVTISLAIGVQRMVKRHALVRRLPTVETLGGTAVICSDKTGTLTRDEMTAREIWIDGNRVTLAGSGYAPEGTATLSEDSPGQRALLKHLLTGAALSCDARLEQEDGAWHLHGDPTEGALIVAAAKLGLDKALLEARAPRVDEIPFSSERKRMTTLHRTADGVMAFCKGAAEVILADCTGQATTAGVRAVDDAARTRIESAAAEMARQALRVLAVAYKPDATREDAERSMIFAGLVGMIDPPRPEARSAIAQCEQAGIRPVMITGDHPDTARAIARELGILKDGRVVVGRELDAMSQAELERDIEQIEVFARVSPEHKLRVVTAWQNRGRVCAMTGDGVNDAPALKKADIGVAMGIAGT